MDDTQNTLCTVFNEALERTDLRDRARYLAGACGDDSDLRRQIEELIRAHEETPTFLEAEPRRSFDSPHNRTGTSASVALDESPGTIVGRYKLLQKIARRLCLLSVIPR